MRKEKGGIGITMSNRVSLKQLMAWDSDEGGVLVSVQTGKPCSPVSRKNMLAIAKAAADKNCATCSGVGIADGVPCKCIDRCKREVVKITVEIDVERKEWLEQPRKPTLRVVEPIQREKDNNNFHLIEESSCL